jgi:hypothetical protein
LVVNDHVSRAMTLLILSILIMSPQASVHGRRAAAVNDQR